VPSFDDPSTASVVVATVCGGLVGIASVYVTRAVYAIEDGFERLQRVHWMWWPALGGIAVGSIGLVEPRTLGVGYDNITMAVGGGIAVGALAALAVAKFVSWSIALGSGTSGGTLAPLLTLGAALGYLLAYGAGLVDPSLHVDPRVAALVGMTAMFAGASRALLASIAFALESTQEIHAVVPIVGGVTLAYFASAMLMKTTIMTEKLARRGVEQTEAIEVDVATDALG
jgi:CIC family chloride channel protein